MTTRAEIIAAARSQIGVRYQHQAALKDVACNCVGLLVIVAGICAIPEAAAFENDIRFKGYGMPPNPRLLVLGLDTYLDRIPPAVALTGDIVLGRIEREPQHLGILSSVDPPYVIHAHNSVGHVAENRIDANWRGRLLRVYRFRGLE
jgi:uncharacterized protein YijF (DUF1287 family)